MKKIAILSVLMFVTMAMLLVGCGGGGSSSTPVEKDVVGITSTLNEFMAAARTNDQAKMKSLLSITSEYSLKVMDFGADLLDPSDNVEHIFYVLPEHITQPSDDVAFVKAHYYLESSGEYLWLTFSMVRADGRWKIDDIEMSDPPSVPDGETTSGSFITRQYYVIERDISNYLALIDAVEGPASARQILSYGAESTYEDNAIYYYPLYIKTAVFGSADFGSSDYGLTFSPYSNRKSYAPFVSPYPNNPTYFGYDSAGGLWYRPPPGFDETPAFKLLEASHDYGSSHQVSVRLADESGFYTIPATISLAIGSPVEFKTPLKTYPDVVKVTIETTSIQAGIQQKCDLHLAFGVGIVGIDLYDVFTDASPSILQRMIIRQFPNGTEERKDPVFATPDVLPGSFVDGDNVLIQLTVTGEGPFEYILPAYTSGVQYPPPHDLILNHETGLITGTLNFPPSGAEEYHDYMMYIMVKDSYYRTHAKEIIMRIYDPNYSSGPSEVPAF